MTLKYVSNNRNLHKIANPNFALWKINVPFIIVMKKIVKNKYMLKENIVSTWIR